MSNIRKTQLGIAIYQIFSCILLFSFNVSSQVWHHSTGMRCGMVSCLTTFDNSILCGAGRGLYKSDNHGLTWQKLDLPAKSGISYNTALIRSLFNFENEIFICYDEFLARSSDGGNTWTRIEYFFQDEIVRMAKNGKTIFTGSNQPIPVLKRSIDDGSTWSTSHYFSSHHGGLRIGGVAVLGNMVCVGYWADFEPDQIFTGVYRSTDNGNSWDSLPRLKMGILGMASLGSTIFALTSGALFRSDDSAKTWKSAQGFSTSAFDIKVIDTKIIVGLSGGIAFSSDTGKTWLKMRNNSGFPNATMTPVKYFEKWYTDAKCVGYDQGAILAGTAEGLFKINPEDTVWQNIGMFEDTIKNMCVWQDTLFAIGNFNYNQYRRYMSTDGKK